MPHPAEREHEIKILRCLIGVLTVETKLIRLRRRLGLKYSPNQPRVPAGQSDGGRWVSDGSGDGSRPVDRLPEGQGRRADLGGVGDGSNFISRETIITEDGGQVLSLRVRAGRGEWDEQHTVVTPDGESRVFETSGATQTIRDGQSGEILSRSTFTDVGVETEARAQPAFLPAVAPALPLVVTTTLEAAALLFTVLAARKDGFGTVLGMTAQSYEAGSDPAKNLPIAWVGQLNQSSLDSACPRNGEVQSVTDRITLEVRNAGLELTPQRLGDVIHYRIADYFERRHDPNLVPELSLDRDGSDATYGQKDSIRLDLYENNKNKIACVYDYKTGKQGLSPARALLLANIAKLKFPQATTVVIIQVRPKIKYNKSTIIFEH